MVLVSSSCPPSRGCTHVLEHFLSPMLQLKAFSVLEIKVLNGKFRCLRVGNANDLHICPESPEKS